MLFSLSCHVPQGQEVVSVLALSPLYFLGLMTSSFLLQKPCIFKAWEIPKLSSVDLLVTYLIC